VSNTSSGSHPAHIQQTPSAVLPEINRLRREADRSLPSSARSCTSILCACLVWCFYLGHWTSQHVQYPIMAILVQTCWVFSLGFAYFLYEFKIESCILNPWVYILHCKFDSVTKGLIKHHDNFIFM